MKTNYTTHSKENRRNRHNKIIEIITNNRIYTQEDLAKKMSEAGYNITQATLSRDIKELKLTKVSHNGERSSYSVVANIVNNDESKYVAVLKEGYVSSKIAMNMIVIKTVSGLAMAVAASLDNMKIEELLGCVAGDDTIICVAEDIEKARTLKDKLDNFKNS